MAVNRASGKGYYEDLSDLRTYQATDYSLGRFF